MKIPFNRPVYLDESFENLLSLRGKPKISGAGEFGYASEQKLEALNGAKNLLTTSATHALEMMAILADMDSECEVIVPSYTFVSTANAFALRGCQIRFADNDEWGNILPSEVERLKTKKTKAVVAVHYAGASADMDALRDICGSQGIFLFEDAAQAIGGEFKGRPLGAIGDLGCYSFHDTKNINSGEGGALILQNGKFFDRAEFIREKGTNRRQFMLGQVDKYSWVDLGSSYVLSELNAAFLLPQITSLSEINSARGLFWQLYAKELEGAFEQVGARILCTPEYNKPNFHMFAAIFPKKSKRDTFIRDMSADGISCAFHYSPLHTTPFGKRYDRDKEILPGAQAISDGIVRLPLHYGLSESELNYILNQVKANLRKLV